jgi:ribosomal-protein-alanine N-acetyltransferase
MWSRLFGAPRRRIAPARPADAAAIAALHARSFARGWSTDEIEAMLADAAIVADVMHIGREAAPAGFALSRLVLDEAEILSIAIAAGRRGAGAATALLAHHLGRLAGRGATRIVLEVDEANRPARALYARFGFEQVGSRAAYYHRADGSRGTALLLAARLASP